LYENQKVINNLVQNKNNQDGSVNNNQNNREQQKQNFDLVNNYQNFNIDGYTQSLNYLKRQINEMQK
jgi:hypothetical protein